MSANYIVSFGTAGHLGRFQASESFERLARVVIRSNRGLEVGTVLGATSTEKGPDLLGEIVRPLSADDDCCLSQTKQRINEVLAAAQFEADARDLPLSFIDGEMLLDGSQAILQAVHWADCDATPLFEELSRRFATHVTLADLTTLPKPKASGCSTCGSEKGGCDSCGTGGGCSTGSCSKGSVKSSAEMTAYFADLRKQMENQGRVVLAVQ